MIKIKILGYQLDFFTNYEMHSNNSLYTDAKSRQHENISQEDEMKSEVKKVLIDSAGELDRYIASGVSK